MDETTRSQVYQQIKAVLLKVPPCPDGPPGGACPSCQAEAITDLFVTFSDMRDLAE